jgi:chaperonin GroES
MENRIKPLGNRVLVKKIEEQEQVKGGIIIPDAAKEISQEAEIIALGSGKNEDGEVLDFEVKVGDRVLISKYGGTEIKRNGDVLVILKQDDILAILK